MHVGPIAVIAGVVIGAGATTLIAKSQLGDTANDTLKRLGVPTDLFGAANNGNPLDTLKQIDPAGAVQLETAWVVSVVGGAFAAVLAYVIVDNLMGG